MSSLRKQHPNSKAVSRNSSSSSKTQKLFGTNHKIPLPTQGVVLSKAQEELAQSLLIFEDNSILVFDKPTGLAVQGGAGITNDLDNLLNAFSKNPRKKPKLVHRIDRETSGVVIAAKNRTSAAFLSEQFAKKFAKKTYFAIVSGNPQNGIIDTPLKRGKACGIDIAIVAKPNDKDAQLAITHFETIKNNGNFALVKLMPITGRMHQLRAHMASIGHPILGDSKYGGMFACNGKIISRLMLHAAILEIDTPNGKMKFQADFPREFEII